MEIIIIKYKRHYWKLISVITLIFLNVMNVVIGGIVQNKTYNNLNVKNAAIV